ncbi:hypothetical protein D9M71_253930 [compost metagenome]
MVGELGQARLVGLGALEQADNGGQAGVVAQRLDPHGQRAFDVQGAGGDLLAGAAWLRQVFAGEQRLVDARLAGEDQRVGRHHGAGRHQHLVAQLQFVEQDALAVALFVQAQAGGRQQVDQLGSDLGGALAGAALQIASGEQEQGEHAHGVEIQLALAGDGRP